MSKYCHSRDGEIYFGKFDTEEEAIEDAKGSYPNDKDAYIGTCTEPTLRWISNEDQIIDSIIENLSEDVGEVAENFDVTSEQEVKLGKMIDETVKVWIAQENIKPNCYQVLDGHIVSLKIE